MKPGTNRRLFLCSAVSAAGLTVVGCRQGKSGDEKSADKKADSNKEPEVTATEDLMREHGVLRRILIVYTETAPKLHRDAGLVSPAALQRATKLFQSFGEEYHEKALEEAYIFPAVKKAGGPAAAYADILIAQHQRGREITQFIIGATNASKIAAKDLPTLADVLQSMARMYRAHAAREDTIVFPAWKQTMSAAQLDEVSDKFEDIERKQFGKDGFEDAVKQVDDIEQELGLADLNAFTAPAPPAL
jgi:hemerythrin-like domain-containing protein